MTRVNAVSDDAARVEAGGEYWIMFKLNIQKQSKQVKSSDILLHCIYRRNTETFEHVSR